MPRSPIPPDEIPGDLGIHLAARIAGIPAVTLRSHFDRKLLTGCYRTPSGQRRISREGLRAYLLARRIRPKHPGHLDRRDSGRVSRPRTRVLLVLRDPVDQSRLLGRGEGRLVDLGLSGMRAGNLSWGGCLPGPRMRIAFLILDGRLKNIKGEAVLAWLKYRGEDLKMGLRLKTLEPGLRACWRRVVEESLMIRQQAAEDRATGSGRS